MGIKQPPAYIHPTKAKKLKTGDKPPTAEQVEKSGIPNKKKREVRPRAVVQQKERPAAIGDTEIIRLVAQPPKSGQFPLYDRMVGSGLTPKQALLALIGRGFEKLDANKLKPSSYVYDGDPVETNRTFVSTDLKLLSEKFDPFSILSKRAFGKKIGEALLVKAIKEANDG